MLLSEFKEYLNSRLTEARKDLSVCKNQAEKTGWKVLVMNFEFIIKNAEKIEYPKCETCKYLNTDNNYCPIIEQFNEVEFGCINHCA